MIHNPSDPTNLGRLRAQVDAERRRADDCERLLRERQQRIEELEGFILSLPPGVRTLPSGDHPSKSRINMANACVKTAS
jgi:hypothetical protein